MEECNNNVTNSLHVLLVPWPTQGHINPMMHLATQLCAAGITVTFANTQVNHERLMRSHQSSSPPPPSTHQQPALGPAQAAQQTKELSSGSLLRLVGVPEGLTAEDYVKYDPFKTAAAMASTEGPLEDLIRTADPPVTCIVGNVFLSCTLNLAKKLNIPHIAFWTQSAASYAAYLIFTQNYHPPPVVSCNGGLDDKSFTHIPGCPPLKSSTEIPSFLVPDDPSNDVFFRLCKGCFDRIPESVFVLANTFSELEKLTLDFIRTKDKVYEIGPLLPAEFFGGSGHDKIASDRGQQPKQATANYNGHGGALWAEDYGCLQWLDQQKPSSVLYVAFGSLAVVSEQQMHEFAKGLEASHVPILLVVRPSLLMSAGDGGGGAGCFPEGFLERMKDRACIVGWAPQLQVLGHEAVGGFLTHAGWNSTLESMASRVPMLCWPYFSDQLMGCRCIQDGWGVGLELRKDQSNGIVPASEVEERVRALMNLSSDADNAATSSSSSALNRRQRVAELGDAAKAAVVAEGGSSRTNFEAFLQFLRNPRTI